MPYAPILFISALTGQRVGRPSNLIQNDVNDHAMRITTGTLNTLLADATARVQPPSDKGRRLKVFDMTQVGVRSPLCALLQRRQAFPLLLSAVSGKSDPRDLRPGGYARKADHPAEK